MRRGFEPNRHATQGNTGVRRERTMPSASEAASSVCGGWRKLAALLLALAAVGLPVNDVGSYALLLLPTVVIFTGAARASAGARAAAVAIVDVAVAGQFLLAPPRIEEGHNVFLPSPALERGLPVEVYRLMANEFDPLYPPAVRCRPGSVGCWQDGGFPDSAFAFSADGIFHKTPLSRSVTALDFSDPVWLRLGFVNEVRYNWTADTDVQRAQRDRRFWMGWRRWHLAMPWYEMVRRPAHFRHRDQAGHAGHASHAAVVRAHSEHRRWCAGRNSSTRHCSGACSVQTTASSAAGHSDRLRSEEHKTELT